MTRAAVLNRIGDPLEIRDDVEVDGPRRGEVRLRMAAAGVCHSDLAMRRGTIPMPLPTVLGHEGAGIVEAVGEGVDELQPGDLVALSWVAQCRHCFYCRRQQPHLCQQATVSMSSGGMLDGTSRLRSAAGPLFQALGCGAFAETTVAPASAVVKVPSDLDPAVVALLGCAVLTGVGAALNTADIRPGDTVAVVGCGGVGLNVVQGARIAGAGEIVAVDIHPDKLALAAELGATHGVLATQRNPVTTVMDLTDQHGADVAFEVLGRGPTIEQAMAMTRRGGQTVLVGIPDMDVMLTVPAMVGLVLTEKTLKGCWLGSA
ncbi:MAG: alcohol dehydrogenase catalytic domain-containing protein, partial [Actinomycetota bacterium]|nr:alcohol dehydrogenase catalytic domain-containing protein [Actinomycetota bacterium]